MSDPNEPAQAPRPTKRRGPPPKLTPDMAERIAQLVEGGATLYGACDEVKIGLSSWHRHGSKYPGILARLKAALENHKWRRREFALQCIEDAMQTDWKAAAWFLERNWPGEFGRPTATSILASAPPTIFEQLQPFMADHLKLLTARRGTKNDLPPS